MNSLGVPTEQAEDASIRGALGHLAPATYGGLVIRRRRGAMAAVATLSALGVAGSVAAVQASTGPARPAPAVSAVAAARKVRCSPSTTPVQPVLAVVGASFSAGVGAGRPAQAWPADLGRILHLKVAVSAVSGAGYVNLGAGRRGPFKAMAGRLNLARLRPELVLIQGGHNDINHPAGQVRQSVHALITQIRCESPRSRIGIVSVFPTGDVPSAGARATDRVIVAAARAADPAVLVFDPIAGHWDFPRIGDDLHPSPAGHLWIARKIAAGLAKITL
jgi:lysophospholipase L1-like esterase